MNITDSLGTEAAHHISRLEQIAREVTLPKGARVKENKVYYLKEGICALKHLTIGGEENSFIYFKPGMLLNFLHPVISSIGVGSDLTRKRLELLDHNIYTRTECTLLAVDGDVFLKFLEENPNLYKILLQSLCENIINLLAVSTNIVSKSASVRVCRAIIDFMSDDPVPEIPRYLTYAEMANYLSMHVMTVTKIFKALSGEGIIKREGRTARVVAPDKLTAIATGTVELKY